MKTRIMLRSGAAALALFAAVAAGDGVAAATPHIAPKQHFVGIVNGKRGSAVVYTVCPGPGGRRSGPLRKGQTMAVAKAAHGHGDTGSSSRIYAWFQPVRSGTKPVTLTFRRYGAAEHIPGKVRVPCSGTGKAVFSSCPYLAPCRPGFVPDTVNVKFENVAAISQLPASVLDVFRYGVTTTAQYWAHNHQFTAWSYPGPRAVAAAAAPVL
jgi:hypothetical protein